MRQRLFLIGANGKTGTELIDLGLQRGHRITAFVRSPSKIALRHPRLDVVQGDPHQADALAAAMPGHDAVLSALGIKPSEIFKPVTLLQECVAATVAAMTRAGLARLLLVSAATLFDEEGLRFAFFRWMLRNQIRDLEVTEDIVRSTPLEWTLARPPRLVRAPDAQYRSEVSALPRNGFSMSFRGVAAFMLDAVEQHSHVREIVGLAR